MKTKHLLVIACLFFSCTKTDIQPKSVTADSENSSNAVTNPTKTLTSHQWMYNSFYMHYVDQKHKGTPLYVRGATNNQDEILSSDRFTFKTDHTFSQTEGDYVYTGTWNFSDNVPTAITMQYDWGTDDDSIVKFSVSKLNFTQTFGYHGDKAYTELVTAIN